MTSDEQRDAEFRTVVAVPARDEAERIAACLRSIALQAELRPDAIVLVVNNTSDGTEAVARALAPALPVRLEVIEHAFPPERASAGAARRMAMERAAALLGEGGGAGVLLTTDGDGRVPSDWVAANLQRVRAGAEAVAGRAVLDPAEAAAIPPRLHEDDALECAYAAALDELAALLDPDPSDPWPRHCEHSGASIAVTLDAYRRAGGMPAAALAEDRRFCAALRRVDARIRHSPEIEVVVSGRTVGRAEGGMADTIRRRLTAPDPYLDEALEPAADHVRRVKLRARFRRLWEGAGGERAEPLGRALGVAAGAVAGAAAGRWFGAGWAALEAASPVLAPRLVPARAVEEELRAARALLAAHGALGAPDEPASPVVAG